MEKIEVARNSNGKYKITLYGNGKSEEINNLSMKQLLIRIEIYSLGLAIKK